MFFLSKKRRKKKRVFISSHRGCILFPLDASFFPLATSLFPSGLCFLSARLYFILVFISFFQAARPLLVATARRDRQPAPPNAAHAPDRRRHGGARRKNRKNPGFFNPQIEELACTPSPSRPHPPPPACSLARPLAATQNTFGRGEREVSDERRRGASMRRTGSMAILPYPVTRGTLAPASGDLRSNPCRTLRSPASGESLTARQGARRSHLARGGRDARRSACRAKGARSRGTRMTGSSGPGRSDAWTSGAISSGPRGRTTHLLS